MVVVVGGRSQGWVGVRWVLGGVCFEATAKILQRRHISGHLKNLRIISGNIVPTYQVLSFLTFSVLVANPKKTTLHGRCPIPLVAC